MPQNKLRDYCDGELLKKMLNIAGWLTDDIVSATQKLLKKKWPLGNGFQDTCLGLTYSFNIEPDEFIQVLYNGHGHWLTIRTVGAKANEVFIYDSSYESVSIVVKRQIATLQAAKSKIIKLNFVDVQRQSGGYDCGLFSLAFATALTSNINPDHCIFDQSKMRKHLYQCLVKGEMEMFPTLRRRRSGGDN